MPHRLDGKQAVITGATGGIGRVACRLFCEEGAVVIGSDVDDEAGRTLEAELRAAGHDFSFVHCDVSSAGDVAVLATTVKDRLGGLDVLYNNAGVILGKPLVEMTDAEWDRIVGVNLRGTFLTMRALVPLMSGRQASIVNMSSGLGLVGSEMLTAYSASKGGVIMLTKSAALELGPDIRVNVICPGVIDTPMPRQINPAGGEEFMRAFESIHVAGRLGRPEEVVAMAVFLASDEASFVTGAVMTVDSGATAR
jgi:2-keto-3-deoxy-L-fuconate dehydrogenase